MHHESFEKFFQSVVADSAFSPELLDKMRTTLFELISSGKIELPSQFVNIGTNEHDLPETLGGVDVDDDEDILKFFEDNTSEAQPLVEDGALDIHALDFNAFLAGLTATPKVAKKAIPFKQAVLHNINNKNFKTHFFVEPQYSYGVVTEPPTTEATMNIPCKYNTMVTSSFRLVSDHYHYANLVENVSVCSHPSVANKPSSSVTPCLYMHNQAECSTYTTDAKMISTATAPVANTTRVDQFSLTYAPMIDFFENQFAHVFMIQNMADNSVVSQMILPDHEFVYDDALVEAERIFDEYMTAYTQTSKAGPVATDEVDAVPVAVQPYFAQLFS